MNFFHIAMILGSLQGFLIAALLLFGGSYQKISNKFLGLLVFTISLQNISNSLIESGYAHVAYWPLSWTLLIPFTLRYFVLTLMNGNFSLTRKNYLEVVPFGGQLLYKLNVLLIYLTDSSYLSEQGPKIESTMVAMELAAVVWCLFVVVDLIKKLKAYETNLPNHFSNLEGKSLHWLKQTMTFTAIIWCFWAFSFVLLQYRPELRFLSYFNWISLALIIYWLAYSIIARRKVFESPEFDLTAKSATPKTLPLKTEEHYRQMIHLMEEDHLYRDATLDMEMLANQLELSKGYVSQIINQKEGKNFFEFVNHYRVNDVKSKIGHPEFKHLSLLGIALEAGFSSKSTFNAAFKKITGLTPSAFQKQQQQQ